MDINFNSLDEYSYRLSLDNSEYISLKKSYYKNLRKDSIIPLYLKLCGSHNQIMFMDEYVNDTYILSKAEKYAYNKHCGSMGYPVYIDIPDGDLYYLSNQEYVDNAIKTGKYIVISPIILWNNICCNISDSVQRHSTLIYHQEPIELNDNIDHEVDNYDENEIFNTLRSRANKKFLKIIDDGFEGFDMENDHNSRYYHKLMSVPHHNVIFKPKNNYKFSDKTNLIDSDKIKIKVYGSDKEWEHLLESVKIVLNYVNTIVKNKYIYIDGLCEKIETLVDMVKSTDKNNIGNVISDHIIEVHKGTYYGHIGHTIMRELLFDVRNVHFNYVPFICKDSGEERMLVYGGMVSKEFSPEETIMQYGYAIIKPYIYDEDYKERLEKRCNIVNGMRVLAKYNNHKVHFNELDFRAVKTAEILVDMITDSSSIEDNAEKLIETNSLHFNVDTIKEFIENEKERLKAIDIDLTDKDAVLYGILNVDNNYKCNEKYNDFWHTGKSYDIVPSHSTPGMHVISNVSYVTVHSYLECKGKQNRDNDEKILIDTMEDIIKYIIENVNNENNMYVHDFLKAGVSSYIEYDTIIYIYLSTYNINVYRKLISLLPKYCELCENINLYHTLPRLADIYKICSKDEIISSIEDIIGCNIYNYIFYYYMATRVMNINYIHEYREKSINYLMRLTPEHHFTFHSVELFKYITENLFGNEILDKMDLLLLKNIISDSSNMFCARKNYSVFPSGSTPRNPIRRDKSIGIPELIDTFRKEEDIYHRFFTIWHMSHIFDTSRWDIGDIVLSTPYDFLQVSVMNEIKNIRFGKNMVLYLPNPHSDPTDFPPNIKKFIELTSLSDIGNIINHYDEFELNRSLHRLNCQSLWFIGESLVGKNFTGVDKKRYYRKLDDNRHYIDSAMTNIDEIYTFLKNNDYQGCMVRRLVGTMSYQLLSRLSLRYSLDPYHIFPRVYKDYPRTTTVSGITEKNSLVFMIDLFSVMTQDDGEKVIEILTEHGKNFTSYFDTVTDYIIHLNNQYLRDRANYINPMLLLITFLAQLSSTAVNDCFDKSIVKKTFKLLAMDFKIDLTEMLKVFMKRLPLLIKLMGPTFDRKEGLSIFSDSGTHAVINMRGIYGDVCKFATTISGTIGSDIVTAETINDITHSEIEGSYTINEYHLGGEIDEYPETIDFTHDNSTAGDQNISSDEDSNESDYQDYDAYDYPDASYVSFDEGGNSTDDDIPSTNEDAIQNEIIDTN